MYKRRLDMIGQHPHPHPHLPPHPQHHQQQQDQRGRTMMDYPGGGGVGGGPRGAPSHSSSPSSYLQTGDDLSCSSVSDTGSEQDWMSPTSSSSSAKRARMGYDGYGASGPSSSVSNTQQQQQLLDHSDPTGSRRGGVVDDDRRKIRRERNKLAAARCRQRRVNLTNTLMEETEALESEKTRLEREIESLYRQTNELQFVLDSHCKRCQMTVDPTGRSTMSDPLPSPVDLTSIKTERPDGSSSQRLMIPGVYDAKFGMNNRPNSLPISSSLAMARGGGGGGMDTPQFSVGGSILTPCSMTLGFMADGHTGLTPITGMPSAAEGPSSIDCLPSTQTLMNL